MEHSGGGSEAALGEQFARAMAAKDFDRAVALLDPHVDFRGLTPNRTWQGSDGEEVREILGQWLEDSDTIEELTAVETGSFADRARVSYSLRGRNEEGPFVVEQQAYFTEREGRIDWMRVLCSGFRPG